MKLTAQHDQGGHPRWWLWDRRDQCIAVSAESFESLEAARAAARQFKAKPDSLRYEVVADAGVKYKWRARDDDGAKLAASPVSFATRTAAHHAAATVRANASGAHGP